MLVGGGPTGVELAGSIAELARFALKRDFRNIDPTMARIILLEAGPHLLAGFHEKLIAYAETIAALENCGAFATLVANFCRVTFDGSGYGKL